MRVKQHVIQGFFISLIFAFTARFMMLGGSNKNLAILHLSEFFCVASVFILLGVIYLDVDVKAAWKIRKKKRDYSSIFTDIWDALSWVCQLILFVIAYSLRFAVYYPAYWITKKILPDKYVQKIENKHRSFTHNFLGIFISAIVFFIIINFLIFLISKNNYSMTSFLSSLLFSFSVMIGFIMGAIIHLMQDSYAGHDKEEFALTPLSPFNLDIKLYGNYSSWDDLNSHDKRMSVFIFLLLFLSPVLSLLILMHSIFGLGIVILLIFNLSLLSIIFLAYGIKFDVKIKIKDKITRLTSLFIKIIVGLAVLNLLLYIFFIKF